MISFCHLILFFCIPASIIWAQSELRLDNDECGLSFYDFDDQQKHNRILNGVKSPETKWPWLASMQMFKKHRCTASIISKEYLLTAAHCAPKSIYLSSVVIGSVNLNSRRSIRVRMRRFIIHPQFFANKSAVINDIAVIKLVQPLTFSNNVQPICLSKNFVESEGKFAYVAGWGLSTMNGKARKCFTKATQSLSSLRNANYFGKTTTQLGLNNICALKEFATPTLIMETVVGLYSFGPDPYSQQVPGIYTRVSKYCDWISQVTHRSVQCIP
uniref:Peptidase S1 domain-containing protein n=1 Tax=Ditylenchus dipsaci TaxID=166011 RepID=A0A915E6S7_9BILA